MKDLELTDILFKEQFYHEYTEEDARLEGLIYLQCCGSCKNFKYYLGSSGFCTNITTDNNIIFIDIMDTRCEKWEVSEAEKEFYDNNNQYL